MNAVSHDLRTPLASIVASARSLQQDDVVWTEDERREFAQAIVDEAQRLNRIVGNLVRERVPDRIIDEADEVELVDMSPHALRQRMKHGNIYPPERAERALQSFFREGNLMALRDMALRKMAHVCEQELEEYMHQQQIDAALAHRTLAPR